MARFRGMLQRGFFEARRGRDEAYSEKAGVRQDLALQGHLIGLWEAKSAGLDLHFKKTSLTTQVPK